MFLLLFLALPAPQNKDISLSFPRRGETLNKYTGGIYKSYGRGWLVQPSPEKENILKEGDWNKMLVRIKGNTVTTWLNGHEMVSLVDDKIGAVTGKIALQIYDGGGVKLRWRAIQLVEL